MCCHLLVDVTEFATALSGWDKLATKCLVVLDFILNIGTWRKFVCGELFEKISTLKHIVVVLIDNDENVFKIMMTSTIHKPA